MAKTELTIAEQLQRATEALEAINSREKNASPTVSRASSPAPAGSLSAALLRTDGLLRYGSN